MKHNYTNRYINKMIMRLDRMILLRNTCNVSRETYYIYLTGNTVEVKLFVKTDRFKNLKADEIKAV